MTSPRILLWDIETSPILGYAWNKWQTDILKVHTDRHLLTIAWKWLGDKKVKCLGLPDYPERYAKDPEDDYELAKLAWELFNEADIVVAHNGVQFDTKKAQARIVFHGFPPPSPFFEVDTLRLAKASFSFTSNRLNDICEQLDLGVKREVGGIETWLGCINGDPKAWARMKKYNQHDVVLLERLYLKLRPWATRHPNLATIGERPGACPKCGAIGTMIIRGHRYTAVTVRTQYQCQESKGGCGGYVSSRKAKRSAAEYVTP